jgi:ribosome-binding protein aMBF1 (putative translation factor)
MFADMDSERAGADHPEADHPEADHPGAVRPGSEARLPPFPGFREMAERRREVIAQLVTARKAQGLSQTVVAARMGTSQSVVARLEAGDVDARLSTLHRYADAVSRHLDVDLRER